MATADQVISQLFLMSQTFQYMTGILLVLVVLFVVKTPAATFLKAYLTGKPIAAVKRKDGKYDFNIAKYSEGIIWHKYGFHQIDPEAVAREKKSGCDFHLALDSIGITLSDKMLKALKVFRDDYKFKNVDEILQGIQLWRRCTTDKCHFEGVPETQIQETTEVGKDGKPKVKRTFTMTCPRCNGNQFEKTLPDLKFDRFDVIDPGFIDNYFMYNMNPRTNEVVTKTEVQNELDAEKKREPLKFIAIGIMIFMIMMAAVIVIMIIGKMDFQTMASISPPALPGIPGLTG